MNPIPTAPRAASESARDELLFPYMVWAKEVGFLSPYCLSQSGMPVPDASFLAAADGHPSLDLMHPRVEACPRLEARLAELFGVEPARVLVTPGASVAMQLVAQRWLANGARVVTEVPSYEPFRVLPARLGAELRVLERRLEDGWALPPERVAAALDDGRAPHQRGHVFLANPNNPTGARLDRATLAGIAGAAEDAGGVLVSNEIYMEFLQPEERVHAFEVARNGVSLGSLTKAYGLGALRIGWIVLGEALADERRALEDLGNLGFVDPATPAVRRGLLALDHLPELIAPFRRLEHECRPHLMEWIRSTPGVRGDDTSSALTAFPRIEGVEDTFELAKFLAREHGVDAVPGEYFGMGGHLRLGFGVPEATLVTALLHLARGLAAFRR